MITTPDARTIIALVGAVLTAVDGTAGAPHWVAVVTAVVTAVMVHLNAPSSSTSAAAAPSSSTSAAAAPSSSMSAAAAPCECGQPGCPGPARYT